MNTRTLIITAGALVALAAPAVASARLSPAEQYQKSLALKTNAKQAKEVFKRQGHSRQIYTYYPAPGLAQQQTLAEIQAGYNLDLIGHALTPVQFPDASPAAPASDDSSATTTSDSSSTTSDSSSTTSDSSSTTSDSSSTPSDMAPAPVTAASFAAAAATLADDSEDC
jgi:hypothetical protein